jgi:hypothetical protein
MLSVFVCFFGVESFHAWKRHVIPILVCLKMGDARWQFSNGHKDDDSITPWHSGVPYFENLPLISAVINIPQILHVSPCQVRLAILWGI